MPIVLSKTSSHDPENVIFRVIDLIIPQALGCLRARTTENKEQFNFPTRSCLYLLIGRCIVGGVHHYLPRSSLKACS